MPNSNSSCKTCGHGNRAFHDTQAHAYQCDCRVFMSTPVDQAEYQWTYDASKGAWTLHIISTGERVGCVDPVQLFNIMINDAAANTNHLVTSRRRTIATLPQL
jgi:hypothetical protein